MARKFQFNWKVSLFAGICLLAFLRLGIWQLEREQEKIELIADRATKAAETPLMADQLPTDVAAGGARVRLTGSFNQAVTLLRDNVVLQGTVGFEVHQLFEEVSGMVFLVNRGFVPMGRTRQDPVEIPQIESDELTVLGKIYTGEGAPLVLDDTPMEQNYPVIVQRISIDELAAVTGREIYPFVIRLAEEAPGALPRYWPDTVMTPEKHFGYALQWFTMALAVTLAWLFFSFRKEEIE
jgi:cytochrome oxidase assembly protein ShyY1